MKVKLQVVQGRPQGKALVFPQGEFVFGRGMECHVRPNSEWVSRQHCMLVVSDQGARLRDLGSRNGTLINGTRLTGECPLASGDKVQIGPLVFRVEVDEADALPAGGSRPDSAPDISLPGGPSSDTAEMRFLETRRDTTAKPEGPGPNPAT